MKYEKCGNYPSCTFAQCECYQSYIFKTHLNRSVPIQKDRVVRQILRFDVVDGELVPIYKDDIK